MGKCKNSKKCSYINILFCSSTGDTGWELRYLFNSSLFHGGFSNEAEDGHSELRQDEAKSWLPFSRALSDLVHATICFYAIFRPSFASWLCHVYRECLQFRALIKPMHSTSPTKHFQELLHHKSKWRVLHSAFHLVLKLNLRQLENINNIFLRVGVFFKFTFKGFTINKHAMNRVGQDVD